MDTSIDEVYFSYNTRLINKNDRNDTYAFANGWEHVTATIEDLIRVIKLGYAYSVWFKDGIRKTSNFVASNVVSIDVDGTNTIDSSISLEFSTHYLTAVYTSCSHTAREHRFRLIFKLERVIESAYEYRCIQRALQLMYAGDGSAAEPSRLFYGNQNAEVMLWDREIPNDEIDKLIKLNVPSELNSYGNMSEHASTRSDIRIPADLMITTAAGIHIKLEEIPNRTPIHCPYHHDANASAFVGVKDTGFRYIFCMRCQTTWHQINPFYDFEPDIKDDFVETMRAVKDMTLPNMEEQLRRFPKLVRVKDLHPANITFLNRRYVEKVDIKPGITFIKSPKGSGKTESLITIIQNIYLSKRALNLEAFVPTFEDDAPPPEWETGKLVLLIGHRQALIRSMCKRLNLNCYLDEDKKDNYINKRDFRRRFGICLDSIKKVTAIDSPFRQYDLVIIDEVEQVLAHLLASTSRDAGGYLQSLSWVIASATSVVAMDADLGWTSFLTLNSMRNKYEKTHESSRNDIYINEYVHENRTYEVYDLKGDLISQLYRDVAEGKRVFVSTNSKKLVDRLAHAIQEKLPNKSVLAITSENSSSKLVSDFLADIDVLSRSFDVLLASPSLGTGIDITFKDNEQVFDTVYGIYEALVNSHTEIDQQLSRVRDPKSVKVWISPRRFSFETHFDVIHAQLLSSNVVARTASDFSSWLPDQVFASGGDFFRTAALIRSSQRTSMNRLKHNFIEYKKAQGWSSNVVSASEDKRIGNEFLALGKELENNAYIQTLLNISPINEFDYLRIEDAFEEQKSDTISPAERLSFRRMNMEIFYCRKIDHSMIEYDDRGMLRRQYSMYKMFFNPKKITEVKRAWSAVPMSFVRKELSVVKEREVIPFLLRNILMLTPIFQNGKFLKDVEITNNDLKDFASICIKLKGVFELQLSTSIRADIRKKATSQLNVFLKIIGLGLVKSKTKKASNGGKIYFYKLNPKLLLMMEQLTALEDKRKDQWAEINARYGFDQPATAG